MGFYPRSDRRIQLQSFAYGYPAVPALFVTKTKLSPLNSLGIPVKNQLITNIYPVQASTLSTLHVNPTLPVIKWLAYGIYVFTNFFKKQDNLIPCLIKLSQ